MYFAGLSIFFEVCKLDYLVQDKLALLRLGYARFLKSYVIYYTDKKVPPINALFEWPLTPTKRA